MGWPKLKLTPGSTRRSRSGFANLVYAATSNNLTLIPANGVTFTWTRMGRTGIGRFLLGKDAAQRIRDDSSWYTSSQTLSDTPPKDAWTEVLELLDSPWHPLAQGLRLAGLRSPDEVDWDWIESGKLSGKRALMMWSTKTGQAILVDASSGIGPGPNIVAAEPTSTPAAVVALLNPLLEEAQ